MGGGGHRLSPSTHRPPRACPVCGEQLHLVRLACPDCATEISGDFPSCDYCGLRDQDLELLRMFLQCRGNLKALERRLGVSYPTVRARVDGLLDRLGIDTREPGPQSRLGVLQALARGEVELEEAQARLDA